MSTEIPLLQYAIDRAIRRGDTATDTGRAIVVGEVAELIATHPNRLVRDQYVRQVANLWGLCEADTELFAALVEQ